MNLHRNQLEYSESLYDGFHSNSDTFLTLIVDNSPKLNFQSTISQLSYQFHVKKSTFQVKTSHIHFQSLSSRILLLEELAFEYFNFKNSHQVPI